MKTGGRERPSLAEIEAFLADAPIFLQPWWLEAVAPGKWDYAVAWRGDGIAAVMPYVRRDDPFGHVALVRPPLTQFLGPWLRPSTASYAKQLSEQKTLMTELIEALPPHHYFSQQFHYTITNWLPFYWKRYKQTTRYTYVLESLDDLDAIWDGFRGSARGTIPKAQRLVRVVDDLGLDRFLEVNEMTFRRQGRTFRHPREVVQRVDAACAERNARRIFFAVDAQGKVHAANYLVWTPRAAYYILGGGDPELRSSGASALLAWEGIQFTRGVARSFDFEGSMVEAIEQSFRAFGARQMPYFRITKDRRSRLVKAWMRLRSKWRSKGMGDEH